jgi:hypothetical protein
LALYDCNPQMQLKVAKPPASHLNSEIEGDATLHGLEWALRMLQKAMVKAQQQHIQYNGCEQITLELGDQMWLSTKQFRTTRPSNILDYKRT